MSEQAEWTARRPRTWMAILVVGVCLAALPERSIGSSHPWVPFAELAHSADLIFIGTVAHRQAHPAAGDRMILTDVTFNDITLIHGPAGFAAGPDDGLTLTFAGGELDGRRVRVSGVPELRIGERCLLFALHDGRTHASPIVGGDQGLYRIVGDAATDAPYVLNAGGGAVVAVDGDVVRASPRVVRIERGVALFDERPPPAAPPIATDPRSTVTTREWPAAEEAMTLDAFVGTIRQVLAGPPPARRVLRPDNEASPDAADARRGRPGPPPGFDPSRPAPRNGAELSRHLVPPADGSEPKGGYEGGVAAPLCYCGYHDLYLFMEQYPQSWGVWYQQNDSAMGTWNQYMDVYRYTVSDGAIGHNGENELAGWLDDAGMMSLYGIPWDSAAGRCVMYDVIPGSSCGEIAESDVAFNAAYGWSTSFVETFNNYDLLLYMPYLMHELGHSWGMQRGSLCTEDYQYNQLSVMHRYRPEVVEDGRGIHAVDAWAIRGNYDAQTFIPSIVDVGIESYYASGLLYNAVTDAPSYTAGDPLSIQNVTIESMSTATLYDVRFRFWLSTDRVLSDDDVQIPASGSYWYFEQLNPLSYWTGSIDTTAPNVPSGNYHVILTVNTGGGAYAWDDYPDNNVTFMAQPIYVSGSGAPSNDDCQDFTIIQDGLISFSTLSATTDGQAHGTCGGDGQIHKDLWYAYQATNCGMLFANTCPNADDPEDPYAGIADFDTEIAIYAYPPACPPSGAYLLGCNDNDPYNDCGDPPNYLSAVNVPVQEGAWYLIRLGGSGQFASGQGQLAVFCAFADVCPADVTVDGDIDVDDLVEIILRWGPCGGCAADINGDGFVNVDDLVEVILNWGPCA